MRIQKPISAGIFILNVIFILEYSIITTFNKFASDDFYNLIKTESLGIFGAVKELYMSGSGRWVSSILECSITKVVAMHPWTLSLYNVFIISMLCIGIAFLIQIFLKTEKPISFINSLNLSVFFVQFCFFISPSKGQTWFWLHGTAVYLLPLICLVWGIYLLAKKESNYYSSGLLFLCFMIAGGSSESTVITGVFILGYYLYTKYKWNELQEIFNNTRLMLAIGALLLAFVINLSASGNYKRLDTLSSRTFLSGIYFFLNTYRHLALSLLVRMPTILVYCTVFFLIGNRMKEKMAFPSFNFIAIACFWSIFLIFPPTYLLIDIAPSRVLTSYYLTIGFTLAWISLFLGNSLPPIHTRYNNMLLSAVFTVMIGFHLINAYAQIKIAKCYAINIDEKGKIAEAFRSQKIEGFPKNSYYSGYLYSGNLLYDDYYYPTKNNMKRVLEIYFHPADCNTAIKK